MATLAGGCSVPRFRVQLDTTFAASICSSLQFVLRIQMLDQYRLDFAEFNVACAREHYLFLSGQKHNLEIAAIYERYGHLFDRDLLDSLKRELCESSNRFEAERVSIRRLFTFAAEQFLENSVKQLTEQIGEYEASAMVEWG